MTDYSRFAVYHAPAPGPLATFCAGWLGHDPVTGQPCPHPEIPGLPRAAVEPCVGHLPDAAHFEAVSLSQFIQAGMAQQGTATPFRSEEIDLRHNLLLEAHGTPAGEKKLDGLGASRHECDVRPVLDRRGRAA